MADLSELWPAIGTIIAGDDVLTGSSSSAEGLLYDAASVYVGADLPIDLQTLVPAIRIWQVGETPDFARSLLGGHEVRLQIDVFAASPVTNEAIRKRLDDILHVPLKRPQGITTASYFVRGMYRTGSVPLSLGQEVSGGGAKLYQLATDWTLKVALRT